MMTAMAKTYPFPRTPRRMKTARCFTGRSSGQGELLLIPMSAGIINASEAGRIGNSSEGQSHYRMVYKGDMAYNTKMSKVQAAILLIAE